jgi:hypothetical protein
VDAPKSDWVGGVAASALEFTQYFLGYKQSATDACGAQIPVWATLDDGLANLKTLQNATTADKSTDEEEEEEDTPTDVSGTPIFTVASDAAARAALIRDVEAALKQDLLFQKAMTTANSQANLCLGDEEDEDIDSAALMQGQEYSSNCPSRPTPCPKDMNEYVRKDSVPCYNCSVD